MLWSDLPPTDEPGSVLPALLVPLGALAAIGALDLLLPGPYTLMALLVAVPATGVLRPGGPRRFAAVALATIGVAAPLGVYHWPERPIAVSTSLLGTAVTTAMIWIACRRYERGVNVQEGLRRVAEVAQRAVLRPVPRRVGPVDAEVRYLAADAEASVGGDLYDLVDTPFGVRVIVGDAMGKGLAAVEKAADVLGAFRELAWHETALAGVATRLDAFLAAQGRDEEFVTAVLVEIPGRGGVARVLNCGHPPPLVLSDGVVTFADVAGSACAPPLGLHRLVAGSRPDEAVTEVPFDAGDRLLLYTDGASEARDRRGRFYPIAERVAVLNGRAPETLLELLETDLRAHVDDRLSDDAALLLVCLDPDPADDDVGDPVPWAADGAGRAPAEPVAFGTHGPPGTGPPWNGPPGAGSAGSGPPGTGPPATGPPEIGPHEARSPGAESAESAEPAKPTEEGGSRGGTPGTRGFRARPEGAYVAGADVREGDTY